MCMVLHCQKRSQFVAEEGEGEGEEEEEERRVQEEEEEGAHEVSGAVSWKHYTKLPVGHKDEPLRQQTSELAS